MVTFQPGLDSKFEIALNTSCMVPYKECFLLGKQFILVCWLQYFFLFVGRKKIYLYYYVKNILPVLAHNYQGDFPTFSSQFRSGCVAYGDFWAQLAAVWPHREHPRVDRTLPLELQATKTWMAGYILNI